MKVKIWKIEGYKGMYDYRGIEDNTLSFEVAMDSRLKKEEVVEFFINKFSKKHRVVVIEATEIREINI